jgi:hypothetical protein
VDDPNTIGELVESTGVDAPKENLEVDADEDDNDELKGVPKEEDLLGCQGAPNNVELVPLLELTGMASEEEAGVLCPEAVPELKTFVAGLEEGADELPEEKDVFPVCPNNGDDEDEPNATG